MSKSKKPSGSQARVLEDTERYISKPDEMMVSDGLAGQIANTKGMNISVSKMYEDGGHKVRVIAALAERGRNTIFPRSKDDLFDSLGSFFAFCGANYVPPTIGLFAVWNGVSVQRVNQIERDKSDPRSASVSVCKDAIRNFLEVSAMDGQLNPILYFHMNKVYYGAVENQQVTVRVEDNTREISDDEYQERVVMLTQGDDGVYRE